MIYYTMPFDSNKNIGRYYNRFMEVIPNDEDWGCFVDADTIFATPDYGCIIEDAILERPEADAFTCYTNRVGCKWQIAPGVDTNSNDVAYHRDFGQHMKIIYGTSIIDVTDKPRGQVMSGFFFMLKKSAWKTIGGFKEDGMLGIDNDLHWRLQKHKLKFYLIRGLYLYHWYRGGNINDNSHLI